MPGGSPQVGNFSDRRHESLTPVGHRKVLPRSPLGPPPTLIAARTVRAAIPNRSRAESDEVNSSTMSSSKPERSTCEAL